MKKILSIAIALILAASAALTVFADGGLVTYSGNAGEFIFAPGSAYSPTDLFPNFKGVMPGDSLTEQITVKNNADKKIKVKIYIRSRGAHEDSEDFLSQLGMTVSTSANNVMAYMFDAAASEKAQLYEWVCLGTLYSGGEVNLDVTLNVPVELGNEYQDAIGYLDWEFMVEEFPAEPDDPKPPPTGDKSHTGFWITMTVSTLGLIIILLVWRKKDEESEDSAKKR